MLDLTNLETIKSILRGNNLKPKKGFGQNFLVARNPLDQIVKSAEIGVDDAIIEIGPGLGVLTQELAVRAKLVLAIEPDYNLVEYLRKYFKNQKNVKIIHQDALTYDLELMINDYKVVSNLPYNITSPVIRKFLEAENRPSEMVLMVQKEVAERLTAKPGSADRGILTVMIELFGEANIINTVPRSNFYPVPSVDSAIIKIQTAKCNPSRQNGEAEAENQNENVKLKKNLDTKSLMKFVKIGFSQKRRQIHHPLSSNLHLPTDKIKDILKSVNIDPILRAEDLTVDEWIRLYNNIKFKF